VQMIELLKKLAGQKADLARMCRMWIQLLQKDAGFFKNGVKVVHF